MTNGETAPKPQTDDEIVARNLRRIREEKGLSVADLAQRMGVGKHRIYDYERPRAGAAQRQFLWSEIMMLCAVLDVTIFELVLPDEGERTWSEYIGDILDLESVIPERASDELRDWYRPDDRGFMMEILFGAQFEPEHIDTFLEKKDRRVRRLMDELTSLLKEDQE